MTRYQLNADVCVIGAGVSGLMAADELISSGLSVDVLEAQNIVGGRVKDEVSYAGIPVELGANWFSNKQTLIKAQIKRYGLETVATYNDGNNLMWWGGKRSKFRGSFPSLEEGVSEDILLGMELLDQAMAHLEDKEPWDEMFLKYDQQSFGQWIDNTLHTSMGREFFQMISEVVFGVESHLVSFLYVLYYSSRSTSLTSLVSVSEGHQEFRFKHGPAQLCQHMAGSITPERLHLNTPVRTIRVSDGCVDVETPNFNGRYRAVLCAVSPPAAKQIVFDPPRSIPRERLLQAIPMGRVIKVQAIYERPFWKDLGLTGQVMSDQYPLSYTIDNSPFDSKYGVLAGFVGTSQAEQFMAPGTDRKTLVADSIDEMFGGLFPKPQDVLIEDWAANPWIGGSYGAYFPPGVMSRMGSVLRNHEPPIYWCGAEYAKAHPCQMEGALESGQRTARLISAVLNKRES